MLLVFLSVISWPCLNLPSMAWNYSVSLSNGTFACLHNAFVFLHNSLELCWLVLSLKLSLFASCDSRSNIVIVVLHVRCPMVLDWIVCYCAVVSHSRLPGERRLGRVGFVLAHLRKRAAVPVCFVVLFVLYCVILRTVTVLAGACRVLLLVSLLASRCGNAGDIVWFVHRLRHNCCCRSTFCHHCCFHFTRSCVLSFDRLCRWFSRFLLFSWPILLNSVCVTLRTIIFLSDARPVLLLVLLLVASSPTIGVRVHFLPHNCCSAVSHLFLVGGLWPFVELSC